MSRKLSAYMMMMMMMMIKKLKTVPVCFTQELTID